MIPAFGSVGRAVPDVPLAHGYLARGQVDLEAETARLASGGTGRLWLAGERGVTAVEPVEVWEMRATW